MISALVIGGDKFSGKPGDWADIKTEIVSAIETASYSYFTKMGAHLFSADGSGDHGHVEDCNRFAIHTQAWSSLRVEGLRSNWNEPRDPAASMADPTLWQAMLSNGAR